LSERIGEGNELLSDSELQKSQDFSSLKDFLKNRQRFLDTTFEFLFFALRDQPLLTHV